MTIYYLFLTYLFVMMIVYDYFHAQKGRSLWIVLSIVFIIVLIGFRYRMGTDTITYMKDYETYPTFFDFHFETNQHYGPLFSLLMSSFRTMTDQFWVFQMAVAAFINFSLLQTIRRLFKDRFFFTFLLIYFVRPCFNLNCESLRETIAISIFFLSIPDLLAANWKKYYIHVFLAIGFHYGAIFLLLFPLLRKLRFNLNILIVAGILLIISPFFVDLLPFFLDLPFVSGHIQELVILYIEASREANVGDLTINYYIMGIFIPIVLSLLLRRWAPQFSKYEFFVVVFVAVNILSRVIVIFYRYENYVCLIYYAFYAAFVYYGVQCCKKKYNFKLILIHLVLLFPILYSSIRLWESEFVDNYQRVDLIDPYSSIFDESTSPSREALYNSIGRF